MGKNCNDSLTPLHILKLVLQLQMRYQGATGISSTTTKTSAPVRGYLIHATGSVICIVSVQNMVRAVAMSLELLFDWARAPKLDWGAISLLPASVQIMSAALVGAFFGIEGIPVLLLSGSDI